MTEAPRLALSRTCSLDDFPGCTTIGAWQETLAACAYAVWQTTGPREGVAWCFNRSGLRFTPPMPAVHLDPLGPIDGTPPVAIFALSILDRIEAPMGFLNGRGKCLPPGGLFFLTFSAWDAEGPDCASGRETRHRIYDLTSWHKLIVEMRKTGFKVLGGVDWRYHGHVLGDHTLASLVLTKSREAL